MKLNYALPIAAALLCGFSLSALADTPTTIQPNHPHTIVQLSGSASQKIDNDTLTITLYKSATAPNQEALFKQLTDASQLMTQHAHDDPAIIVSTDNFTTYPNYNKEGKLTHWQGQLTITLQSKAFKNTFTLVNKLVPTFSIEKITYSVSAKGREAVANQLIPEAIQHLQQKAQITATSLNKHVINIEQIAINQYNNINNRPLFLSLATKSIGASNDSNAYPMEAGQSEISVNIDGKVVLQ